MIDRMKAVLEADPRVTYALLFGSAATGRVRTDSDVDVAIGLAEGAALSPLAIGALAARPEEAAGRLIDLVLLDEAPPGRVPRRTADHGALRERPQGALRQGRPRVSRLQAFRGAVHARRPRSGHARIRGRRWSIRQCWRPGLQRSATHAPGRRVRISRARVQSAGRHRAGRVFSVRAHPPSR
jgi:predicted nucleotidyltransferase